jgi:hypothetical protein
MMTKLISNYGAKGRIWAGLAVGFFVLVCATSAWADLTFPAIFKIVEQNPKQFRLTLTVPLIKGRYMKVRMIVPEGFRPEGEPETSAGSGSLTRSWQVAADPASLSGAIFGLEGLLGTSREVRFLLTTLDGRRYETVLRSTRSIFVVPQPAAGGELVAGAARDGLRRAVRDVGLWSLLACVLLSAASMRMRVSTALAVSVGFLGCWAVLVVLPRQGLSDAEFRLARGFFVAGCAAGVAGAAAVLGLIRSLLADKARHRMWTYATIAAAAWGFYQGAGLVHRHGSAWLVWLQRISESAVYHWFSPFAADWAMARLRLPLLTLGVLVLFIWALVRIRRPRVRAAVAGGLLILAVIALPCSAARLRVPFLAPDAPSPRQAQRILEPMLSEIYHALNLEDEGKTYDQLAKQVSGDLVTDLYLDSRRRLVAGTREGASVIVRRVEVQNVGTPRSSEAARPAYPCRWTVTAKVTHWQHSHERRNVYEGDLRLVVEDDRWKLAGLNLRSEEREVVPGSFQSR